MGCLVLAPLVFVGCGGESDFEPLYDEAALDDFADPELEPFRGDLTEIRERGVLRVLVTPSQTAFFVDGGAIRGIQAEYAREFAARLNRGQKREAQKIRIKFVPVAFQELIPALRSGRGDLAAAFLTITDARREQVAFSAPLRRAVSEVLVTRRGREPPASLEELAGWEFYVLAASSYAEHLRALDARLREEGKEGFSIEEADPHLRSADILEFVSAGIVDATVLDDYEAELWKSALPNLEVHEGLALSEQNQVAWAVRKDAPQLKRALDGFAREAREGALLGNLLMDRYFGDAARLENPTTRDERDKLQRYLKLFRQYGERFGFDPLALAAQAYQESRLDPSQRSAAGAVGLMQILPSTAADPQIAIENIEDPAANIHAGAKYLAFLRDRYFSEPELSEWDRRAFSWAAYNAGPRKVRQARGLSKRLGLDPNVWFGHVEVAAARLIGREPVRYVANTARYYVAYRFARIHEERRREAADGMD